MSRAVDRELVACARGQWGLLRRDDTIRLTERTEGLERLVAGGLWQEVLPGVLAAAALNVSRELVESAAMLWEPRRRQVRAA